jgi:LPS-assembly protein
MFAGLSFAAGPITGDSGMRIYHSGRGVPVPPARIPSKFDDFTELRASLGLHDHRGDSLGGGWVSLGPGGSGTLLAGLDPIFDARAPPIDASGWATLSARAVLGSARLGYDALLPGRASYVAACNSEGGERRVGAWQVQQHAGSLTYESACHCFRLILVARITDCGDFSYHAAIDLGRSGTGAATGTVAR